MANEHSAITFNSIVNLTPQLPKDPVGKQENGLVSNHLNPKKGTIKTSKRLQDLPNQPIVSNINTLQTSGNSTETSNNSTTSLSNIDVDNFLSNSIRTHSKQTEISVDSYQQMKIPGLSTYHLEILTKGVDAVIHQAALKARTRSYDTLIRQRLANQNEEMRRNDDCTNKSGECGNNIQGGKETELKITHPPTSTNSSTNKAGNSNTNKNENIKVSSKEDHKTNGGGGKKRNRRKRDRSRSKILSQSQHTESYYNNPDHKYYNSCEGRREKEVIPGEMGPVTNFMQHPQQQQRNSMELNSDLLQPKQQFHHHSHGLQQQMQPQQSFHHHLPPYFNGNFHNGRLPPYGVMVSAHQQPPNFHQQIHPPRDAPYDSVSKDIYSKRGRKSKSRSRSLSYGEDYNHRSSRKSRSWSRSRSRKKKSSRYESQRSSDRSRRYPRSHTNRGRESRRRLESTSRRRSTSTSSSQTTSRRRRDRRRKRLGSSSSGSSGSSSSSMSSSSSSSRSHRHERQSKRYRGSFSQSGTEDSGRSVSCVRESRRHRTKFDDQAIHSVKTISLNKKKYPQHIVTPSVAASESPIGNNLRDSPSKLHNSKNYSSEMKHVNSEYHSTNKTDRKRRKSRRRNHRNKEERLSGKKKSDCNRKAGKELQL